MTKKKTLPKKHLSEFQEYFIDKPITLKEIKALSACTSAMRQAAFIGGFTQYEIYETLLHQQEDSERVEKMSINFLNAIGNDNLRRIYLQYVHDKG